MSTDGRWIDREKQKLGGKLPHLPTKKQVVHLKKKKPGFKNSFPRKGPSGPSGMLKQFELFFIPAPVDLGSICMVAAFTDVGCPYMGLSLVMELPLYRWMVFVRGQIPI